LPARILPQAEWECPVGKHALGFPIVSRLQPEGNRCERLGERPPGNLKHSGKSGGGGLNPISLPMPVDVEG